MGGSTATKDRESENKYTNLGATIESSGHNIVVFVEKMRVILAKPPLCRKSENEIHQDRCINTDEEPSHVPEDDGHINIGKDVMGPEFIGKPKWHGNDETQQIGNGYPLIASADGKHILGDAPGNCKSIELV